MAPPKRIVSVTYVPIHDDDRPTTEWNRIKFKANVPVELDRKNPAHWYSQLLRKEGKHPTTGGVAYSHVEERVFMGDVARTNSSFEVDGVRSPHIAVTTKVPPAGHEWAGTNRDDLIPVGEVNWPADIPLGADSVEI